MSWEEELIHLYDKNKSEVGKIQPKKFQKTKSVLIAPSMNISWRNAWRWLTDYCRKRNIR